MFEFIDTIRLYFYNRTLTERVPTKVTRTVTNIDTAKSIGIIYDGTIAEHDSIITTFTKDLRERGKTVELLTFVKDKKIISKGDIPFFNPKGINWCEIPTDERVNTFCNKPFDLLLCAMLTDCRPLEYIAYTSRAKYRVGMYNENKTRCYDLMIEVGEQKNLHYLLQQMLSFLEKIK